MQVQTKYDVGNIVFLRREANLGVMCQGEVSDILIEIDQYGVKPIKYALTKCLGFHPIGGYYYETELCLDSEAIGFVNAYHDAQIALHQKQKTSIDGESE
jgi:hypothetical protein